MSSSSGGRPPDKILTNKTLSKKYVDLTMEGIESAPNGNVQNTNQEHPKEPVSIIHFDSSIQKELGSGGNSLNNISSGNVNNRPVLLSVEQNIEFQEKPRASFTYDNTSAGPYSVYIENSDKNFNGKLNPIKIGDIIYSLHPDLDNKIKQIESIGKNRIRIIFKDFRGANVLIKSEILKQHSLTAYIPKFILYRTAVIKKIDTEFSDEYLKNKITLYDFHSKFEVENVKRMTRKIVDDNNSVQYVPTQTIMVTFKCQTLPKYVAINHVLYEVEPYIQKVILCYNCFRYGHLGKQCKSRPRCLKCNGNHASGECNFAENSITKCFSCQGEHLTTQFKVCPEFNRQKLIKKVMSENNVSYRDAALSVPKQTYASVAATNNDNNIISHSPSLSIPTPQSVTINHRLNNISASKNINRQPLKRQRLSNTNNATNLAHKQILTSYNQKNIQGAITTNPVYQSNIQTKADNQSNNVIQLFSSANNDISSIILEVVMFVLNILKQKNSFEFQKSDLINLIQKHLGQNNVESDSDTY